MLNKLIFLEISEAITNSECVIVADEITLPADITLPTINAIEVNNDIDNDDSPVAKTSDLTNTALISEGNIWLFKYLSIFCPAYFKYILQNR